MINKCYKPLNDSKSASSIIGYYEKKVSKTNKVHIILVDLCMQLQDDFDESESEG